jgi:hypothetical protein
VLVSRRDRAGDLVQQPPADHVADPRRRERNQDRVAGQLEVGRDEQAPGVDRSESGRLGFG